MPVCNGDTFQIFMDEFSLQNPAELKIMVLDNGAFHKTQKLVIPDNIILIFLPPYSPELNPAEKIWAKFKRDFTNKLFLTLDSLEEYLSQLVSMLSSKEVISICSYNYIFLNPFWRVMLKIMGKILS
jgi:transposase